MSSLKMTAKVQNLWSLNLKANLKKETKKSEMEVQNLSLKLKKILKLMQAKKVSKNLKSQSPKSPKKEGTISLLMNIFLLLKLVTKESLLFSKLLKLGKSSVTKLNWRNMESSLMLNPKLKMTSQKEISTFSNSSSLTKKNLKKVKTSILRKLVSKPKQLGLNCLIKKSLNMSWPQNLEIKKENLKKIMHLKAEVDPKLSLLVLQIKKVLSLQSIKKANLKKVPSLQLTKNKKARNLQFWKMLSPKKVQSLLLQKMLSLKKVQNLQLWKMVKKDPNLQSSKMVSLKKAQNLQLWKMENLKKVLSLLLVKMLSLKKAQNLQLTKKVNLKKAQSHLLIKKLSHKRDLNLLMIRKQSLLKLENLLMLKWLNLKKVQSLQVVKKENLKKVLFLQKLIKVKRA